MGSIKDAFDSAWADGPTSSPTPPHKSTMRALGGTIDAVLTSAVNGLIVGGAVVYSTRAALYANLVPASGALGVVFDDGTASYNGIYVKSGASGVGSWSLTGLALPATFATTLASVVAGLAEVYGAIQAVADASQAVDAQIIALVDGCVPVAQALGYSRPGISPRFFGLEDSRTLASNDGPVVLIASDETIVPTYAQRIEPGRVYRTRFVFRRQHDVADPANDAVRISVEWFGSSYASVGATILADVVDLTMASGRVELSFAFARADADDVDLVCPPGAVFFRPTIKAFGEESVTLEIIETVDLSAGVNFSPDNTLLLNEIASLEARLQICVDRIEALEAAHA